MGQEFIIKSPDLEDKINQLLPSQGGFQAGVDLSASTQIIPIVDLTETAEGSNVRQDIQKALSFKTVTPFDVSGATSTVINTTGYYRIFGNCVNKNSSTATTSTQFIINDGSTDKIIWSQELISSSTTLYLSESFDFMIFLEAGHSFKIAVSNFNACIGCTRQIADISGNLTNP